MIKYLFLISCSILLISCGNNTLKDESLEIINVEEEKLEDWEIEEIFLAKEQLRIDSSMKKNDYFFSESGQCDSQFNVELKNRHKPFNINTEKAKNELTISFNAILTCGSYLSPGYYIKNDTLFLGYHDIALSGGECFCCYQYQFIIQKKSKKYQTILLRGIEIN